MSLCLEFNYDQIACIQKKVNQIFLKNRLSIQSVSPNGLRSRFPCLALG